jgi:uncharacterized membrane protein
MARTVNVATYDTLSDAYKAAEAIEDRTKPRPTRPTVKAGLLLAKDETGQISVLESKDRALFRAGAAALAGALLGLPGGPLGAAIGAGVGAVAGIAADAKHVDADETFVAGVLEAMEPRSAAIVLETNEAGVREIEGVIAQHHGRTLRRDLH